MRRRFRRAELLVRQHANRRFGFFLDPSFAGRIAAPTRVDEGAIAFHDLLEPVVIDFATDAVLVLPITRGREQVELYAREQIARILPDRVQRGRPFLARVAPDEHRLVLIEVLWADLHSYRDA